MLEENILRCIVKKSRKEETGTVKRRNPAGKRRSPAIRLPQKV
jgi:hypothetical protein